MAGPDKSAPTGQSAKPHGLGPHAHGKVTKSVDRAVILTDMFRGLDPPPGEETRKGFLIALEDFSPNQLIRMQRAGVRFWPFKDPLPADKGKAAFKAQKTGYHPQLRVIFLGSNLSVFVVVHELGHAWDHVQALHEKELHRIDLDNLNERQLDATLKHKSPVVSDSHRMQKMLERYNERLPRREDAFDLGANTGESTENPHEFYAEGYAVFHSNQVRNQAHLLFFAPELYDFLEKEAKSQGLVTPERAVLEKQIQQEGLAK